MNRMRLDRHQRYLWSGELKSQRRKRISVGAVASLSIAALALVVIFGLGFAKGERDQSTASSFGPSRTGINATAGQRGQTEERYRARAHQAVALITTSEPLVSSYSNIETTDAADSPSRTGRVATTESNSGTTIVQDGVTVVTPHLLVPVVTNLDYLDQRTEPSSSSDVSAVVQPSKDNNGKLASSSVSSSKQKRRYASRNLRARRSTGSSHTVVVGLAASRRIVRVVER